VILTRGICTSRARQEAAPQPAQLTTLFTMLPPKAYFLTWTTYGTHLRGDAIESTDHARKNRNARRLPASPALSKHQADAAKHEPIRLCVPSRTIVEHAIREHADYKNWQIFTLSVRTNHVHLLISAAPSPEIVMNSCKAWATRGLRAAGLANQNYKIWTRHGSTRWINDDASLEAAFAYIAEAQDGSIAAARYSRKPLPPGRG